MVDERRTEIAVYAPQIPSYYRARVEGACPGKRARITSSTLCPTGPAEAREYAAAESRMKINWPDDRFVVALNRALKRRPLKLSPPFFPARMPGVTGRY